MNCRIRLLLLLGSLATGLCGQRVWTDFEERPALDEKLTGGALLSVVPTDPADESWKLVMREWADDQWRTVASSPIEYPDVYIDGAKLLADDSVIVVRTGTVSSYSLAASFSVYSRSGLERIAYRPLAFLRAGHNNANRATAHAVMSEGNIHLHVRNDDAHTVVVFDTTHPDLPVEREVALPEFLRGRDLVAVGHGSGGFRWIFLDVADTPGTDPHLSLRDLALYVIEEVAPGTGGLIDSVTLDRLPFPQTGVLTAPDKSGLLLFDRRHGLALSSPHAAHIPFDGDTFGTPLYLSEQIAESAHGWNLQLSDHAIGWIRDEWFHLLHHDPHAEGFPWTTTSFAHPFGRRLDSRFFHLSEETVIFGREDRAASYDFRPGLYRSLPWFNDGRAAVGNRIEIPSFGDLRLVPAFENERFLAFHPAWGWLWFYGNEADRFWCYFPEMGWLYFDSLWNRTTAEFIHAFHGDVGGFVSLPGSRAGQISTYWDHQWNEWLGTLTAPAFADFIPLGSFTADDLEMPGFELTIGTFSFTLSGTDTVDGSTIDLVLTGGHTYERDSTFRSVARWTLEIHGITATVDGMSLNLTPEMLWDEEGIELPQRFELTFLFQTPESGVSILETHLNSGRREPPERDEF